MNIRMISLLMAAGLTCSTAQAERLSLSQLKQELDALAQQLAELQTQPTQSSLAGFHCPTGLAVTGFNDNGLPVCTSPWPDAAPPEPFDFEVQCERNYDQDALNTELSSALGQIISAAEQALNQTFDFSVVDLTLSDVTVSLPGGMTVVSLLNESNVLSPCEDEILIDAFIPSLLIEGVLDTEGFQSAFTYTADQVQISQTAKLFVPDITSQTLPVSLERPVESLNSRGVGFASSDFELASTQGFPGGFNAVAETILEDLVDNNVSDIIGSEAVLVLEPSVMALPVPVTAHLTEL